MKTINWKRWLSVFGCLAFFLILFFTGGQSQWKLNPKLGKDVIIKKFEAFYGLHLEIKDSVLYPVNNKSFVVENTLSIKEAEVLLSKKMGRKVSISQIVKKTTKGKVIKDNIDKKQSLSKAVTLNSKSNQLFFFGAIALGGIMIWFWIFEVVSIYITALFPLILAIPLGLLTTSDLAEAYGNGSVYLFFGGFILALGLEKWKVHEQIARRIVSLVGNSKPRILLGFLLSTGLLSMWISNTATALMMLPMALAIIQAMPVDQQKSKFSVFLLLSIAYAASIGGMATLVGSPPNTQMASILEQNYNITISFFDWMKIGIPVSLTLLLAVFVYFYFALGKERNELHDIHLEKKPWTVDQYRALAVFGMVVILWSFRELIIGATGFSYKDESAAIFGGILLFIIPSQSEKKPLLEWQDTEKLPWGILLLFGGGLALAKMLEKCGVVSEITQVFSSFQNVSITLMVIIVVVIAIFATEIMSNLALVTIFVPIVATFALEAHYPILQLCLPLTLAASCAFMLPVGTPPNAIVFSSGLIKIHQMAKIGFILNIIATIIVCFFAFLFF